MQEDDTMEVKSCRNCRRIFNYVTGPRLCPACKEELEKKFSEVKKYIEEHKNATVNVVSEEMEVSVQQINQWIREERLSFSEDSAVMIHCEKCGARIRTGRYCDSCKGGLTRELSALYKRDLANVVHDTKKKDDDKMRFLGK